MRLTQQLLSVSARSVVISLSSSKTMCRLDECTQPPCQRLPFQTSEIGDTHFYFIRPMAPTRKSEPNELQNVHRNSAAGLSNKHSLRERSDIMVWLAWL